MMLRMLRTALALAHAAWLVAFGLGYLLSGPVGLANAAVGGGIVVFFYAAGQGVQLLASELDPQTGMGLVVASFLTRATLLGLLLVGVTTYPSVAAVFRPVPFFAAVLLVLAGWLGGMFFAWSHMRVPVYDAHWDPRPLRRARRGRGTPAGRRGRGA